jgi:hypothetical protein
MRIYTCKLSREQIAEGIRLRAQRCSWLSIGRRFGVDAKTVRRYCDPAFIHASNGRNEFLGLREANEEHHRRMWGDLQFKRRVLEIRRAGASEAKHFTLGVATESGTAHAQFVPRAPERFGDCALADVVEPIRK